MKAFTRKLYGGPEVLQLEEVEKPTPQAGQLLVKVAANSANPADWHILRGTPILARFAFGLFKPRSKFIGADFAGVVEAVGEGVTQFKAGDRVFGETLRGGSFAQYTCVAEKECAQIPEGLTFRELACVPVAGLTALQALITHGKLQKGESVLINGASGGVGHFAVQIAKAYGAKVTGVCSAKNAALVVGLGADQVIAYDQENIHQHKGKYDLVVDTHGNLSLADFRRMGQRGVMVGFTSMPHMLSVIFKAKLSKYPLAQFTAETNTPDLETLASLVKTGKIKVHIDATYSHQEIPEAIGYIEAMRTRGKVAMVW
ncbi:NAD(P)-dependent alcohol dehydrogenase [Pedobacter sp. SYSU D00535]|uniref:NAD(P)-dependent alcohol dehydrogenase n=1 Tax=Pedobacter sp. SYSU D00535 TaxID=2810308 RepID=UPI001A97378D|nr:NAD(P)-dependent alcohol dehydrogenase [Pedobacter sp. SYSU D00535]